MDIGGDDRAVTVQIGAVLLFGVLIVSLSIYQATVVPSENKQVEYRHSQTVQGEMQEVRNALLRSTATGTTQPTSVTLGTQYPGRVLFVNPPSASGSLRTEGTRDGSVAVTISGAEAVDPEEDDYWNGTSRSFTTGALVYEPDYNVYGEAPTTVLENTLAYNTYESGSKIRLSGQTTVDGNRITVVLLNGSLSSSRSGSADVTARPVSTSTERITIRNDTADTTVTIPTRLTAAEWNEMLADEPDVTASANATSVPDPFSLVDLELASGETYELTVAKVGVGTVRDPETEAAYIVPASNAPPTLVEGSETTFSYVVKDRYGNPVGGESVSLSLTNANDGTVLDQQTTVSDADGVATFRYTPGSSGLNATVNATIYAGARERHRVVYRNRPVFGAGGVADGGNSDINPSGSGAVRLEAVTRNQDDVTMELNNTGDATVNATGARLNFYFGGTSNNNPAEKADLKRSGTTLGELTVGGSFTSLRSADPVGVEPDANAEFTLAFKQGKVKKDDFFVVTFAYDNGESETYFVAVPKN